MGNLRRIQRLLQLVLGVTLTIYGMTPPEKKGVKHREEIDRFAAIAKADKIQFHSMTYQKLIAKLAGKHREKHCEYIPDRYL